MESHIYKIGHTCCHLVLLLLGQCAAVSSFARISFVLCVSFGHFFCCAVLDRRREPIAFTRFMLSIRIVSREIYMCLCIGLSMGISNLTNRCHSKARTKDSLSLFESNQVEKKNKNWQTTSRFH